jgi:nucleotide-binding universal stress UspA family protein
MYKHLLIATDGSSASGKAVAHGLALAKTLAAKVTAVNGSLDRGRLRHAADPIHDASVRKGCGPQRRRRSGRPQESS